jgi:CTP:molybdopterin cytidylyltransferase MocA
MAGEPGTGSVAAIVLAAGASLRLGRPKQLLQLGGETLLERAVRVAQAAGLHPVFGVVAPHAPEGPPGMVRVTNHQPAEGMASSIRAGVKAMEMHSDRPHGPDGPDSPAVTGAIVLACDQPAVTAEHLRALAAEPRVPAASNYAGRNGTPAYFPRAFFPALLALTGDKGARDLLQPDLLQPVRSVPLFQGEIDIDTVQDFARAEKLFAGKHP